MQSQNLDIKQQTGLRLTAQQVRFVRMLEMNAPELDEAVEREMEDNPALADREEDVPVEQRIPAPGPQIYYSPSGGSAEPPLFSPADTEESLYDSLNKQLSERNLPKELEENARYIIGSLDSNGYLTSTLQEIVEEMALGPGKEISIKDAEEALKVVRSLEPAGIGATGLQNALEMQLLAMPQSKVRDNALAIVRNAFDAFAMKHRHKILSQLKLSEDDTTEAISLILSLNPKPGASVGNNAIDNANVIIPDYIVRNEFDKLTVSLNNRIPELKIEKSFEQAVSDLEKLPRTKRKKGSEFIISRYNDARDFIRILNQRQQTMMNVISAILKIQEEYFRTGDIYTLKPMMIKNISDLTGYDASVISRATNNKYVATSWGIFPLRHFFSDTIGEDKEGHESVTNRKIEAAIKKLVETEDKNHPLSDRKIADVLNKEGFKLSRRTVAKYRDRIGLPVARLRKSL